VSDGDLEHTRSSTLDESLVVARAPA